jgi:hypothetical protein
MTTAAREHTVPNVIALAKFIQILRRRRVLSRQILAETKLPRRRRVFVACGQTFSQLSSLSVSRVIG